MTNRKLDELKICTVNNISNFDFTPELGAMFGGRPFFIKKGESLIAPEPVAYRLAVNLAKAILLSKMPEAEYGKGDDRSSLGVFSSEEVDKLVDQIMQEKYKEEKPAQLSEAELMKRRVEELNSSPLVETKREGVYADKAEVIEELQKRGIKHDARGSKASLEKLLTQ